MNYRKELEKALEMRQTLMSQPCSDKATRAKLLDLRARIAWLEETVELQRNKAERLRAESNLGKRFAKRRFDTFDSSLQPEAYRRCKNYAEGFLAIAEMERNSLILAGGYGLGKTHLAAAIINHVVEEHGIPCLFNTWAGWLEEIKQSYQNNRATLANLKKIPLLVIDDYGKDKESEWNSEMLFEVMNTRYESNLPTIMTTNLTMSQLKERVGTAVFSRMSETFMGISFAGSDVRSRNTEVKDGRTD